MNNEEEYDGFWGKVKKFFIATFVANMFTLALLLIGLFTFCVFCLLFMVGKIF